MAIPLRVWLDTVHERFTRGFAGFELVIFEGTKAELEPELLAWQRPAQTALHTVDVARLAEHADTLREARSVIEAELARIGGLSGQAMVAVYGVNVMAGLFPPNFVQRLYQFLRSGGRIVVISAPLPVALRLPATAYLQDWRSVLRNEVSKQGTADYAVSGGAFVS